VEFALILWMMLVLFFSSLVILPMIVTSSNLFRITSDAVRTAAVAPVTVGCDAYDRATQVGEDRLKVGAKEVQISVPVTVDWSIWDSPIDGNQVDCAVPKGANPQSQGFIPGNYLQACTKMTYQIPLGLPILFNGGKSDYVFALCGRVRIELFQSR
jgi:hypothetical protein